MARIRIKSNTRRREAMIKRKEKLAKELSRKPSVSVGAEGFHQQRVRRSSRRWLAGAENKPRANVVILRSQIKRNRKRLRSTAADLKRIYSATNDVRELMFNGVVKPGALLRDMGKLLVGRMKDKISKKLIQSTGSLINSIEFKVSNG